MTSADCLLCTPILNYIARLPQTLNSLWQRSVCFMTFVKVCYKRDIVIISKHITLDATCSSSLASQTIGQSPEVIRYYTCRHIYTKDDVTAIAHSFGTQHCVQENKNVIESIPSVCSESRQGKDILWCRVVSSAI